MEPASVIREKSYRDWLRKVDANAKRKRLLNDEQRAAFKKDYESGLPVKMLIEKYGFKNRDALYNQVKRLHLTRKYGYWTPARIKLLQKGHEMGLTDKDMMTWFITKTEGAIATARRRARILSTIDWDDQKLLQLEELKRQGLTDREIAKRMKTTSAAVQHARLRLLFFPIDEVREVIAEEANHV